MFPKNWPAEIDYCNVQSYIGFKKLKKDFIPGVKIEKINDPTSVVFNQYGLFATEDFQKFDILGQYTGNIVNSSNGGIYVASLDKCNIDAQKIGNELRFINDFRNISNSENVVIRTSYIDKKPRVIFIVTKDIKKGDQLLTDYGDDYWKCINNSQEP